MTNRDVLIRLLVLIDKRNDGGIDPVDAPVLGPIAEFALPDVSGGNRRPQIADEFFRVITRID